MNSQTLHHESPSQAGQFRMAPPASAFADLRPRDLYGWAFVAPCLAITTAAIYLSCGSNVWVWLVAQGVLAISMLQWFVLLHEAGHKTLFKSVRLNKYAGHLAGLFAGIPFESWKAIHGIHHHWTGWQDLDATTATLVPRTLSLPERMIINVCWKLWIPLFSLLYRLQNYWNLPRLYRIFPRSKKRRKLTWNLILLLACYLLVTVAFGWQMILQVFGLALVLTLVMQDILILSQHSHIPMELSHGEKVDPFKPAEQEAFTRSLLFPKWFSTLVLLNMDAHELHHMYTSVPGYFLHRISYETENSVTWWRWIWRAKQVPGEVLLFQNSHQSGFNI